MPQSANFVIETHGQHRAGTSIALHILPGAAILLGYILITPVVRQAGWPSMTGMWLAALLVLIPLELGILAYLSYKKNGNFSLGGIVLNRVKIPARQFIPLVIAILIWSVMCLQLLVPLDNAIQNTFSWLPAWFFIREDISVYSKSIQLVNGFGAFLVTAILAPWAEELYFRGYLLPRMSWMKKWVPIGGAFLFSLYHFWSPWQIISRFLAVLPLVYIVNWKRDLRIGIAAHWVLNSIGTLGFLVQVLIS